MTAQHQPVSLTLTFTPRDNDILVRWEARVLGVRHSRLLLPYRGADLQLVIGALELLQTLRNAGELLTPVQQARLADLHLWHPQGWIQPDASQRIGRALYAALISDPAGAQALQTVRDYAAAEASPLALNLRLPPDAVELAALPWELLWDQASTPLLLSQGRAAACTRYLDLETALPAPRPHRLPLRVLALAPRAGIPAAVREAERRARQVAYEPLVSTGHLVVDEVSPLTRRALVDALQTGPVPDVIHYYGHGRYHNGTGALLLDSPDGGESWTDASTLAALVGGVRMVVLFACQGAMIGPAHHLITGIAPALSAAGVPLVLGMQLTVRVSAATRATSVMYRALVAGWSIQQAVALVRQALYVEEQQRASWYVPVLYVRAHDTAPVHLLAPTGHPEAATRPRATLAAGRRGGQQTVVARQGSHIGNIAMQSDNGEQTMSASNQSRIERARVRGASEAQQQLEANDNSDICNIDLEA